MCFYIQDSRPDPLVAEKDIVCYKYGTVHPDFEGEEVFCSRYQNYHYRFGKENERVPVTVRRSSIPFPSYINVGYHSYSCKETAQVSATRCQQRITDINQHQESRGFGPVEDPLAVKVVKCIIPEGTVYYYNSDNQEYVSEQIIIESIL